MKKWFIISFIIIFISVVGISVKIYQTAIEPVKAAEQAAISKAKEKIHLSKVDNFHIYHGLETVNVIEGKNIRGEKVFVWLPEKSKKIFVKRAKEGISKQDAINKLLQEKHPKKIISVRLGMENNIPLWEIYYRSDNNLINYYYVSFQTGKWMKKIENL